MSSNLSSNSELLDSISSLGPWFHNFHLPNGLQTAPDHFLGDFPMSKWRQIEKFIPRNLRGWKCLDIGCNAGFYSFELAKRGADVLGIDSDPHYLDQARWIEKCINPPVSPRFEQMQVHDLAHHKEDFDLVLFMGVFYHLRYPSLALDTVSSKVKKFMIFQTLSTELEDSEAEVFTPEEDYSFSEREIFERQGWPKLSFIELSFSNDSTNWWVPNHSAVLALLRSTGFSKIEKIAHEIYICTPPPGGVESARTWDQEEWTSATSLKNLERKP